MQWILVLMIYGTDTPMAITAISGFTTGPSCEYTGEHWKKTKVELERDYVCLPADQK